MQDQFWYAIGLSLFASLFTGVGSAIAFFAKKKDTNLLALGLGFSAGVMVYVSFVELLKQSTIYFSHVYQLREAGWYSTIWFFTGIMVAALIDKMVPEFDNPHEVRDWHDLGILNKLNAKISQLKISKKPGRKNLSRVGLITAILITIHNFPEGMATFTAGLSANHTLGIAVAVAIAIHNIPEGISVSVPIFYATGDRKKAFIYSFLSGFAEPVGALLAFLVLRPFLSEPVFGGMFAAIAGSMVYISFDELLPTAREYGKGHIEIWGLIIGMAVMAASLNLI